MSAALGTVAALWRYPVKSLAGEQLDRAAVTERGVLGDRAYGLVDAATGRVATAKARGWPGLFALRAALTTAPRPGQPMPAVTVALPDGRQVRSDDPDAAQLLSAALDRRLTLERPDADGQGRRWWPDLPGADERADEDAMPPGTFVDAAAVHLLTTASLRQLADRYPAGRMDVRRFRPNVVIDTGPDLTGFVENGWVGRTVRLGDEVELAITRPCPRCVMTTLPQGDLPKDPGILRTAARHNDANAGVYATVVRGGTVRRGEQVTLDN